ncbi:MAG TPA: N-acetylmuramoyl-L-alanine amidase [Leptolyngbyaceae cyanobacterium]
MAQIFISAAHGGFENGVLDPGAIVPGTTEAAEMIRIRDLIVPELRSRGFTVLAVPDDLSAAQTIAWINSRCRPGDVAVEIQAGAFNDTAVRGALAYYIANNEVRRTHAELLMLALLRRVPQMTSRGVKPDTASGLGSLVFTRNVSCPSLIMEVGFLTNAQDLALIQNRRRDIALGLADGLASWSRAVSGTNPTPEAPTIPSVNITINGGPYDEKGILLNDNAYIPIDLADQLGLDLTQSSSLRRISYNNIVYVKAVDLRNYNISIGWDASTRTVLLKTLNASQICPGTLDLIMGYGKTSEIQMMMFLKSVNEAAVNKYSDLPKLYREEASIEGVNYDIAFCQMCVETAFLTFNGVPLKPAQNNFGGIGSASGGTEGASFPSARIGVRAQVQHLKAYASTEPLVQVLVDPRFRFVKRGVAPLVEQLSGRWNADLQYGQKIIALLRRLYESAGLL